jgi:hypothetical protein
MDRSCRPSNGSTESLTFLWARRSVDANHLCSLYNRTVSLLIGMSREKLTTQ